MDKQKLDYTMRIYTFILHFKCKNVNNVPWFSAVYTCIYYFLESHKALNSAPSSQPSLLLKEN